MPEADSSVRCPLCQASVPKSLYKTHIVNSCHLADDTGSSPPKVTRRDIPASRARSSRLKAILRPQTVQDKLLKASRDEALFLKLRLFRQRSPVEHPSSPKPLLVTVKPSGSENDATLEALERARANHRLARGFYQEGSLLSVRLLVGRERYGQNLSDFVILNLLFANSASLKRLELAVWDAVFDKTRWPGHSQPQLTRLRAAKLHKANSHSPSPDILGSSLRCLSLSGFQHTSHPTLDARLTEWLSGFRELRSLALSKPPKDIWEPLRDCQVLAQLKSLRIAGGLWLGSALLPGAVPELRRLKVSGGDWLAAASSFSQLTSLSLSHLVYESASEDELSQAFRPLTAMPRLAHLSIRFERDGTSAADGVTSGWLSRWTELGQLHLVSLALEVPAESVRLHVSPRRLRCLRLRARGRPSLPQNPSLLSCQQLLSRLHGQVKLLGRMEYPQMQSLELEGFLPKALKGFSPCKFPALEAIRWNGALHSASVDRSPLATCLSAARDPSAWLARPLRVYVAEAAAADAVVAEARGTLASAHKAVEEAVRRRETLDRDHRGRLNEAFARLQRL